MKRVVVLLMVAVMVVQFAGCADEKSNQSETIGGEVMSGEESTTAEEIPEGQLTISNPFVAATDEDIFEQLGIPMWAGAVASLQSEYIVSGKFAQLDFLMSDADGNDIKACLRAEKNKDADENLHGLYFSDMSEPEILEDVAEGLDLSFTTCDGGNWKIYEWSNADIFYSLTYSGEVSQMQIDAALDQVMTAIGIFKG